MRSSPMGYALLAIMLALAACTLSDKNAVDWSHINYADINCHDNPSSSGCKAGDNSLSTISKGGKR